MMTFIKEEDRIMELIQAKTKAIISKNALKDVKVDFSTDYTINAIVVNLKKTILGDRQWKKWFVESVPETWKDHFKLKFKNSWWMKLWLKNHPIKFREINVDITKTHTFPEYVIPERLKNQKYVTIKQLSKSYY